MNNANNSWFENSQIQERHNDIGSSVILGNQWGDEGKGKVTDRLMQDSDVVIRFNGGHNAGHTVKVGDKEFDLHILPSGMVTEGKENIITSGCVLGINLNKIDINLIHGKIMPYSFTLDELLKRNDGNTVEVGLVPELKKLQKGGINIKNSGLKISSETIVIGMHNVLLDAFDEVSRVNSNLRAIGSTGSGISRAYSSETQRYHFTLNDLIHHEDTFYDSIRALWLAYAFVFPNISSDDLIDSARKEREEIIRYIKDGEIEIIENETQYIKNLHRSGKKIIGEGAQSSMIGSGNSFFGTASDPSLQNFCQTTGLTVNKVGNIMLVHKIPPSSVGERPGYLKHTDSLELDVFRKKYSEVGVSTGRARDLFFNPIYEAARGASLNVRGIDDESKIVPVYNRVDGVEDMLTLDNGRLRVATGYSYKVNNIINGASETVQVGISGNERISPKTLLKNYPEKSAQSALFHLTLDNVNFIELTGDTSHKIESLLGLYNAAIFRKDQEREYLIGTGPDRNDLEIKSGTPLRNIA